MIHESVGERQFQPVFEAGNQSKFSKTVHSRRRLPPAKDAISSWFFMVRRGSNVVVHCRGSCRGSNVVVHCHGSCHGSLSWFTVMVRGGSWWFVVVFL